MERRSRGRGGVRGLSEIIANLLLVLIIVSFSYVIVSLFYSVMARGRTGIEETGRERLEEMLEAVAITACYIGGDGNLTIVLATGANGATLYNIVYNGTGASTIYVNGKQFTLTGKGVRLNSSSLYIVKVPVPSTATVLDVMVVTSGGVYEVYAKKA